MRYLKNLDSHDSDPSARYSVAINVEVRFVRSKSAAATSVRVTDDPNAPAVQLTEEQIRERYPWDYRELTAQCRNRYPGFKVDQQYYRLRRGLEGDTRLAYVRRLDPQNPKSPKKTFYSQAILKELDKTYKAV